MTEEYCKKYCGKTTYFLYCGLAVISIKRWYMMLWHTTDIRVWFNHQLQSVIISSELRNKSLKNFHCRCQIGNKDSRYCCKQNIFNFQNFLQYNFIKDEMFKEETFASKNTAKSKDFTMPKRTSSGFFLSIKFSIKRILTTTEYCNLQ